MRVFVIILILLALLVGYFVALYIRVGIPWSPNATMFIIITLAGAFGGLLYTFRDSGLELPHRNPNKAHIINLGWIADCAYGIAGAYVVFLILPTELNTGSSLSGDLFSTCSILTLIRLLALALVGGYGGRSIVDRALANIAKKAEEAEKSAQETKEKINQIQELDTKARELVSHHLDKKEAPLDVQSLKDAIKVASRAARFEIFKEARIVRSENWKGDVPLMERTIPIFEALIDNEAGEKYHRNHAQLGYALKDQGGQDESKKDWARAHQELSKAIELRDREGVSGYLMYEFNRALCSIKLGKDSASIERDIQIAARDNYLHRIIKKYNIIVDWAKKSQFDLDTLDKKPHPDPSSGG